MFLALAIGCFFAARTKRWLIAGILGALACLTRINGLILLPALAFEVWDEYRTTRKFNARWLAVLLIAAGFASYLALNYFVAGNPTMFLTYQREHWQKFLTFPWEGIWGAINRAIGLAPRDGQMTGTQELFFVGIGLFAIVAGLAFSASVVSRVDDFKLAALCQHVVCFERSALHARDVSAVYFDGVGGAAKLVAASLFHRLVNSISGFVTSLYVRGWWAF